MRGNRVKLVVTDEYLGKFVRLSKTDKISIMTYIRHLSTLSKEELLVLKESFWPQEEIPENASLDDVYRVLNCLSANTLINYHGKQ